MIFSDFYKSPKSPLSKLRHSQSQLPPVEYSPSSPSWVSEEYSDLLSKDKAKQKAAVKRYLDENVKNDWDFVWPPVLANANEGIRNVDPLVTAQIDEILKTDKPVQDETREDDGYKVDDESEADKGSEEDDGELEDGAIDDAQSIYSVVSDDPLRWKPRLDWASDLSDSDVEELPDSARGSDSTGSEVKSSKETGRDRRRRQLREEMSWNQGLACFEARRNAWTSARVARVRSKPPQPQATSPRSRRRFFRRSMSTSPPSPSSFVPQPGSDTSGLTSDTSSLANHTDKDLRKLASKSTSPPTPPLATHELPVETLLYLAPPLLPPHSSFRAAITPSIYLSLYDKIILHNMQPACPINLKDMVRASVAGWQRDGEWPPRPAAQLEPVFARRVKRMSNTSPDNATKAARRMSFGLLGRDKEDEARTGKGFKRSIQRALGLGISPEFDENTSGVQHL